MDSNFNEMRLLFDVDIGAWRDGIFWKKAPTDIPLGRNGYRVHTFGAGEMLHINMYPIHNCRAIRAAKGLRGTSDSQKEVNWRNSRERVILIAETNFVEGKDTFLTLTYAGALPDFDQCQKDVTNFIRCLRRYLHKSGTELRYLYSIAEDSDKRIHVHLIIGGEIDIAVLRMKWKHGLVDAELLDNSDQGVSGIAKYLHRQNDRSRKDPTWTKRHTWQGSLNLNEPVERVSDSKVSNRQVKMLATDLTSNAKYILENLYPGYYLINYKDPKMSDYFDGGLYFEFIMRSMDPKKRLFRKKRRVHVHKRSKKE